MVRLDIRPKHGKLGDPMVITVFENNIPVQILEVSVGDGRKDDGSPLHHIVVTNVGVPKVPLQVVK